MTFDTMLHIYFRVTSCLIIAKTAPSVKEFTIKGKKMLPVGANSFLL